MKHILIVGQGEVQSEAEEILKGIYRITLVESFIHMADMEADKPDLILISSSALNSVSGGRLSNRFAQNKTPILAFVPQGDEEAGRRAYKWGVEDVIQVPFLTETLHHRVEMAIELDGYRTNSLQFIGVQEAISVSIAELVERRDMDTGGHLKQTTLYYKAMLEEVLNHKEYRKLIPQEDVADLIRAVPLHDIGKIGISDDVLRKASTLNYNEFEYMKTHTILGKETFDHIMKETGASRFLVLARDLAYCHHERWDGSGYPCGLKGEEIPFYARILSIVDVYDALTSRRTYKEPFSHLSAVENILEGRGTLFDPNLVDIFYEIHTQFEEILIEIRSEKNQ